jgi:hypothetical protein
MHNRVAIADRLHLVPRRGTSSKPLPGRWRWLKRASREIEISQVFKRVSFLVPAIIEFLFVLSMFSLLDGGGWEEHTTTKGITTIRKNKK